MYSWVLIVDIQLLTLSGNELMTRKSCLSGFYLTVQGKAGKSDDKDKPERNVWGWGTEKEIMHL